jgi:hypothetical protein
VRKASRQLKENYSAKRIWAPVVIALSLGLVAAAQRDLQRRPADEVRGSKLLWRLVCLNALGAASYFRWGRRASVSS